MVSTVILWERIIIYLLQILQNAGIFHQDFFCYVEPPTHWKEFLKFLMNGNKTYSEFPLLSFVIFFSYQTTKLSTWALSSNHCRSLLIRPKFNKCFFTPATLRIYCQYIPMLPIHLATTQECNIKIKSWSCKTMTFPLQT